MSKLEVYVLGNGVTLVKNSSCKKTYLKTSVYSTNNSSESTSIDYNDLENKPALFNGNHSGLNLDDGANPHGTTKADVGLGNVPNTDFTSEVNANNDKVGITTTQANNIATNNNKVSFPEAPINSVPHARIDGTWQEVQAGGTTLVEDFNNPLEFNSDKFINSLDVDSILTITASNLINGKFIVLPLNLISGTVNFSSDFVSISDYSSVLLPLVEPAKYYIQMHYNEALAKIVVSINQKSFNLPTIAPVTNLAGTYSIADNEVSLSWDATIEQSITHYAIEKYDGSVWNEISTTNNLNYADTIVSVNQVYQYRVIVVKGALKSNHLETAISTSNTVYTYNEDFENALDVSVWSLTNPNNIYSVSGGKLNVSIVDPPALPLVNSLKLIQTFSTGVIESEIEINLNNTTSFVINHGLYLYLNNNNYIRIASNGPETQNGNWNIRVRKAGVNVLSEKVNIGMLGAPKIKLTYNFNTNIISFYYWDATNLVWAALRADYTEVFASLQPLTTSGSGSATNTNKNIALDNFNIKHTP